MKDQCRINVDYTIDDNLAAILFSCKITTVCYKKFPIQLNFCITIADMYHKLIVIIFIMLYILNTYTR